MPHIIVEYTDNLGPGARIPALLKTINDTLIAQDGAFPIGGIRSRAFELHDSAWPMAQKMTRSCTSR